MPCDCIPAATKKTFDMVAVQTYESLHALGIFVHVDFRQLQRFPHVFKIALPVFRWDEGMRLQVRF